MNKIAFLNAYYTEISFIYHEKNYIYLIRYNIKKINNSIQFNDSVLRFINPTLHRSWKTIESQAHKPRAISSVNVRQIIMSLFRRNNYSAARMK